MSDSATADRVLFREKLVPGPGALLITALVGLALFLCLLPLGLWLSLTVGVVGAVGVAVTLFVTAPRIEVTTDPPGDQGDADDPGPTLRAGAAVIGVRHLAEPVELEEAGMRAILGPKADARSYVLHRSWVRRGGAGGGWHHRPPPPQGVENANRPPRPPDPG
ncbi:MAG: DUF3093 family protein, partial [Actinomycetaceae bacterium]